MDGQRSEIQNRPIKNMRIDSTSGGNALPFVPFDAIGERTKSKSQICVEQILFIVACLTKHSCIPLALSGISVGGAAYLQHVLPDQIPTPPHSTWYFTGNASRDREYSETDPLGAPYAASCSMETFSSCPFKGNIVLPKVALAS